MLHAMWQKYGKSMLFPSVILISVLLYIFFSNDSSTPPPVEIVPSSQMTEQQLNSEQQQPQQAEPELVMVDVKGAVNKPGVYSLSADSRVIDAITLAGGYKEQADSTFINHAQKIVDEMVIYVPKQGEVVENIAINSAGTTANEDGKVNLNTADEAAFMTLPGIGPSKAQAILSYRDEHGPFQTIEELKSVTGIGDKTFERLADMIFVQ